MLQITDLKDSPGPSKKELRIAMKQVVQLLQDNYPEFVARNIAKKCNEEYNQQMELYKQNKLEEAANLEKEEEELKQVLKQEALQLLKKMEKTENIIKVSPIVCNPSLLFRYPFCFHYIDMGFGVLRLVCGLQGFTLRYAGISFVSQKMIQR
ncbi:hypothetical protein COCNU_09G002310 [Cocos nucifera]|uniref:Uncharacterized protein n=1 Tax=Cocos nucifera TaxID=13894 RepID=A0A8K0N747_COCNU|nr:hypothetical protein COCNU_09G002310 [Cocos nucifera]